MDWEIVKFRVLAVILLLASWALTIGFLWYMVRLAKSYGIIGG